MRRIHSFAGPGGLILVLFMALTGAVLSLQPAVETLSAPAAAAHTSVAELAGRISAELPNVERITRSASGTVVAYYVADGTHAAAQIDPASGQVLGAYAPSPFFSFVTELHRSIFLGGNGHIVSGIAALVIALLALSGVVLLANRAGGWRRLLAPSKGTGSQRLHADLGRIAVVALLVTALSGVYMSGVNFGFIPDGAVQGFSLPPASSGGAPAPIASLAGLGATAVADLRELVFPAEGDTSDVFTLTSNTGIGSVDQSTGAMLAFTPNSAWQQVYEAFYTLHTGQGVWWLSLVLGLAALAVPALAVTGTLIWWSRRSQLPHLVQNAPARLADTVLLVGSESGSTWSFATTLHDTLTGAGHKVHVAAMNDVKTSYPRAQRIIVLAATYGDGAAPLSANHFLGRIEKLKAAPTARFAVLGFGDRSFPQFCRFAAEVDLALIDLGMEPLLPLGTINRQSAQEFAAWGHALGQAMGETIELVHVPGVPRTAPLALIERLDYGTEVQAPTSVLRFALPQRGDGRLDRFEAGDLVGILPPGSLVPRYYSLATSSRDGVLEICVRKQTGGLCSEFLHGLEPGATIDAFIRPNREFRPNHTRKPVILVGAGAGIAPLVGFVRHNQSHRPVHLFFGGRDPNSDFLYRDELLAARDEGRLSELQSIFSRRAGGGYVQDRLLEQADEIRRLVAAGAQILVCGGIDMAIGVRSAIDDCLRPIGLSSDSLRQSGRYLEDAY